MTTNFYVPGRQYEVVQAQAEALRDALSLIAVQRPDLDPEVLKAQIFKLVESTPHSAQDWAAHCLMCVRHGEPLPWEPGATGVGSRP